MILAICILLCGWTFLLVLANERKTGVQRAEAEAELARRSLAAQQST